MAAMAEGTIEMPRLLAILILSATCLPALAQDDQGYALIVGHAYLGSGPDGEVREVGVVIRDGRIVAVERDLTRLPPALPRIEYPDGYLTPGLVAAASDLGGTHSGPESLGAGYRAIDAFDRYGDFRPYLAAGVTTVHIAPGEHRLLAGQGAIVKLAGKPSERVVSASANLCLQLGDPADEPPALVEFPFPPSSDVAIVPAENQRPRSRLGRLLGLREEIAEALTADRAPDLHLDALATAWRNEQPLWISAERATDLLAGVSLLRAEGRAGLLVGATEVARVAKSIGEVRIPVVYRPRIAPGGRGGDLGTNLDAIEGVLPDFAALRRAGVDLILGPPRGGGTGDLRFSAILAHQHGLDRASSLRAITDGAADALGIGDRLGRVAPGLDADLVVWNTDPLSIGARPLEVVVGGRRAFHPSVVTGVETRATVVRAGTIWVSPERQILGGEVLIEDGRIVAVGTSVPRPPYARVIDAGPDAFVTPGFIDAHGHLGLGGDRGAVNLDVRFGPLLGVPDLPEERVARAGVTTVLLSPYSISTAGSPIAAVKTWGDQRGARLIRDVAAVGFRVTGDALAAKDGIRRQLESGKKYIATWEKYEKALAEFEEKKAKGETVKPIERVEETTETTIDPITGIWEGTASGGPLPAPETGRLSLRLTGASIEGRVIDPPVPVEHRIVATLSGTHISGTIEVDMDLPGLPTIEAELTAEDTLSGTVSVLGFVIQIEGHRVSKEAAEFKVTRRRRSREDGRPVAPRVDPRLEPLRDLLEKRIPALVEVDGRDRIAAILELFLDEEKLPVILLGGEGADHHAGRLVEKGVGVVVPVGVLAQERNRSVNPSDRLARRGVRIGFQSAAEDGARELPTRVLYAVDQGLAADAAIAALTSDVARMFQLEDRIGSLEPGRDGDLLIFRGHPFRDGGRLERVFVSGEEVAR